MSHRKRKLVFTLIWKALHFECWARSGQKIIGRKPQITHTVYNEFCQPLQGHLYYVLLCFFCADLSEQWTGLREPGVNAHEAGSGTTKAHRANAARRWGRSSEDLRALTLHLNFFTYNNPSLSLCSCFYPRSLSPHKSIKYFLLLNVDNQGCVTQCVPRLSSEGVP